MANQEDADNRSLQPTSWFGSRMKRAREDQELTQRQLSETLERDHRVKLDSSAITRIENGSREPRIREALAIAEVLDFPLTYGGLLDDLGGEAQFSSAEARLKRQMILARRRIISACTEVHVAFDGILGSSEEITILKRRGVETAIEWADSISDQMRTWFSPSYDESGSPNHVHVADSTNRLMLQKLVDAITSDLYWTDDDYFKYTDEEKELVRKDDIRRARQTLIDVYGEAEFQQRFGSGFDEPDT